MSYENAQQQQQHQYNAAYNMGGYVGYPAAYAAQGYSAQGYYPAYDQSAMYTHGQYAMPDYNSTGRGRGGFRSGRGGFRGGRASGTGGLRARRKKPFVGGTLETQREWERETACCFYLQGSCKFAERCRFVHEKDSDRPCQFGISCRAGHADRAEREKPAVEPPAEAPAEAQPAPQNAEKFAEAATADEPAKEAPAE